MLIQDSINTLLYDQPTTLVLKDMLLVDDVALTHEVFAHIHRQFSHASISLTEAQALIALLPTEIDSYPSETQLLLAKVFLKTQTNASTLPSIDSDRLLPEVKAAWLKTTEQLQPPKAYAKSLCEQVLSDQNDGAFADFPVQALEALCQQGLIPAEHTRPLLLKLLKSQKNHIVLAALKVLGNSWSTALPCPDAELLPLLNNDNFAETTLTTLVQWKSTEFLIEFAHRNDNRYLTRHAIQLIDSPLDGSQISQLLDIALADAVFLAPSVVKTLRNQHRRQHNFAKPHIEVLFKLFVLAPNIEIGDLVEILRPSEKRWLRLLVDLHPQDKSWERHIQLLGRINTERGNAFLLEHLSNPELEILPPDIIVELAKNGVSKVEPKALSLLENGQTNKALEAIRHIGGIRSKQCLWAHIDGSRTVTGLSKSDALHCALAIEGNLSEVLGLIPTNLLSSDQLPLLSAVSSPESTDLLVSLLESDNHTTKLQAIQRLGNSGSATCLEAITEQLLFLTETDDIALVHHAIQQIGKRLHGYGSARPQALLHARSAQQAGEMVMADSILNLCKRSTLSDEVLARLLETVSTLKCHQADKHLSPYLKHQNPQVQKHAITGLCHNGCTHLSDQLRHFLQDENIHTRRAAITGFTKLKATWFDTEITESLNHPNMNIKKAAADALLEIGTLRTAPLLIQWIAAHDNQGLQNRLVNALKHIAGNDYVPLVLAYLSRAAESDMTLNEQTLDAVRTPQGQLHLLLALNHELSARAVVIAYEDGAVWAEPLVRLINSGEYQLKDDQGPSHIYFEAWRLGINLPSETTNSAVIKPKTNSDELLNGLINNSPEFDPRDLAQHLTQAKSLSTAQTMRLQRQLPTLVNQLNSPLYGEACITVLSLLVSNLSQGQKTLLSTALLEQLKIGKLPLEALLHLLKQCDGILPHSIAIKALDTSSDELQEWGLHSLISTGALDKSLALSLLDSKSTTLRSLLVQYSLKKQWHEGVLAHCINAQPPYVEALQHAWHKSPIPESKTINYVLSAISSAPDLAIAPLLKWAASLSSDKVDALLLSYLTSSNTHYREIIVSALSSRPSTALQSDLSDYLTHKNAAIRQAVATILLAWPDNQHLPEIVKQYLQGSLSNIGHLRLSQTVLDDTKDWILDDEAKKKHIALLCHSQLSVYEQLERLWPYLDESSFEVRATAEAAIRGLPTQAVLDYLWPKLEAGKWGYLNLLGRTNGHRELVGYLESGNKETQCALLEYFLNLPKPIRTECLLEVLLSIQSPELIDLIIPLSGKLSAWQRPKARLQLLGLIQHFMANDGDQEAAISALTEGLEDLPTQDQLTAILQLLNEQTQQKLLPLWTEHCLQSPSAIHELPAKWQPTVYDLLIKFSQDRDEEKARGALRLLVDIDHESILDTLEEALLHPKSRVRAYAHRLLRKVASKAQYLESTLILLNDKELALRCGAIRTLSFRGYTPAVKGIADQLFIKKKNVAKVAKAGLLTMGNLALPDLKHAASHVRPDQRVALLEIISEIENRDRHT